MGLTIKRSDNRDVKMRKPINRAGAISNDIYRKGQPKESVHIALIIDATRSRSFTWNRIREDFAAQVGHLDTDVGSVILTVLYFKGNSVFTLGTFRDLQKLSERMKVVECDRGLTKIARSLDVLTEWVRTGQVIPIDAALVFGDTTDGDMFEDLVSSADRFGKPIVTLLEDTHKAQEEIGFEFDTAQLTTRDHRYNLAGLSHRSGVEGCPINYDSEVLFVDYIKVIAAGVRGEEAVTKLKISGEVSEKIWQSMPEIEKMGIGTVVREEINS